MKIKKHNIRNSYMGRKFPYSCSSKTTAGF